MAVKQLPKISDLPEPPDRLVGDQERFDVLTFNSLKAQKKMINEDLNKTLIPALNQFAVDVNASVDAAAASATAAGKSADKAQGLVNQYRGMTAEAVTLAPGAEATATFHPGTEKLTLGIPRGDTVVGLTHVSGFELDADTGHLEFVVVASSDITDGYIDDRGNLVISVN